VSCGPEWLPAQPYATEDDLLCDCVDVDFDSDAWTWAVRAASRRVYEVTMGAFPGCMTSLIRPCRRFCSTPAERLSMMGLLQKARLPPALPYIVDDGPAPVLANLWACDCGFDPCTCTNLDALVLPYRPVHEVTEVKIDGEVFTDWKLVGARLYRTDGKRWPTCNDTTKPDTEPGTWSVTERWGTSLPPDGVPLVAAYACELARLACGSKKCALPDGLRVVSRPGVEYAVVDYGYRGQVIGGRSRSNTLPLTGYNPLDDWLVVLLGGIGRAREAPRLWTARRARRGPSHRLESVIPTTGTFELDGVVRETLHVRSNEGLTKTVAYDGRAIEAGTLAINRPDGTPYLEEFATITDGAAVFDVPAASWPAPFPLDGSVGKWDMIVKLVGGDWEAVAGGQARFHLGVAEPVF